MLILNETKEYLHLIHPIDGCIYVAMLLPSKHWQQTAVGNNSDALAAITKYEESKPIGVYISQARFKDQTNKRDAASAENLNCLFIDLDVGDGPNKYTSKNDALKALKILEIEFLSATAVVDTGGGLHAYWCFGAPLAKDEWLPLAERFKHALTKAGVLADPSVTADAARVLRVPGTNNRKNGDDRVCTFVSMEPDKKYSTAEIEAALKQFEGKHAPKSQPLRVASNLSRNVSVKPPIPELPFTVPDYLFDPSTQPEYPPAPSAEDVELACPSIKALVLTGGTTEDAWSKGLINTARFTVDPESTAQRWSQAYGGYEEEEVSKKLATKQHSNSGPTSCEKIASLDAACAAACNGCIYLGKATSPIHAAQKFAANKGLLKKVSSGQAYALATTGTGNVELIPVFDPTDSGNAAWLNGCLQCSATSKRTLKQCGAPAIAGKNVCRFHGGKSTGPKTQAGRQRCAEAKTIHGNETRAARTERSLTSSRLAVLESVGFTLNMLSGTRTRGPKPNRMTEAYPELQESVKRMMLSFKAGKGIKLGATNATELVQLKPIIIPYKQS